VAAEEAIGGRTKAMNKKVSSTRVVQRTDKRAAMENLLLDSDLS